MADMRSAFRIQQLQEKQRQAQAASPTVGKAEQEVSKSCTTTSNEMVGRKYMVQCQRF